MSLYTKNWPSVEAPKGNDNHSEAWPTVEDKVGKKNGSRGDATSSTLERNHPLEGVEYNQKRGQKP